MDTLMGECVPGQGCLRRMLALEGLPFLPLPPQSRQMQALLLSWAFPLPGYRGRPAEGPPWTWILGLLPLLLGNRCIKF